MSRYCTKVYMILLNEYIFSWLNSFWFWPSLSLESASQPECLQQEQCRYLREGKVLPGDWETESDIVSHVSNSKPSTHFCFPS